MEQRRNLDTLAVLEWLWDVVAKPILDALGFTTPPPTDNWPRVWWIPTGQLTRFPLHAAGYHRRGSGEAVLDRVVSSYSPPVKALIHGRQRCLAPPTSARALLVAMQDTPRFGRLPFAAQEVAALRDLCSRMAIEPVEPNRRKRDVLSYLPSCEIFHFAGHGYTDSYDPSRSQLLLDDWESEPLTVATLLEINLRERRPFLAYLSACGTGEVKQQKSIDESIHLINAFKLAGFRHIISTLWEVNDQSCVDMSRITYEEILGGMTDESVCRGLHKAIRELRQRWLDASAEIKRDVILPRDVVLYDEDDAAETLPLHWVPYVHFGV